MSNIDPQIKITTQIDPSGAVAGGGQVVAEVSKIEESTERGAKGFGKLVEEAGSMRESRRLAQELFETMQGGGETIQGLTGLMRVLIATMDFNPILAALTLVGGAFFTLSLRQDEHKDKSEKSKKATDDLTGSLDSLKKQADATYPDMLAQLQAITAEYEKQIAAAHELQRAKDELQSAKLAQDIANDEEAEGIESAGQDASQRAEIKRRHEQTRLKIRQQYAQGNLTANRNDAAVTGESLSRAYAAINGGAAGKVSAAGIKSDAQAAADRLAELGDLQYTFDARGNRRGLSADELVEYDNLQRTLPGLQAREKSEGPSFEGTLSDLQAKLKALQEDQDKELHPDLIRATEQSARVAAGGESPEARAQKDGEQIAALAAQINAINGYKAEIEAAQKEIEKSTPKFKELNGQVEALSTKIDAAKVAVQTAQTKFDTLGTNQRKDIFDLDLKQEEETARQAYTDAQARRDAQKADLESKLKATSNVAQRGLYEREIADLVAKGETDKAGLDLKYGKIDQAQYRSLLEKAADTQKNSATEANNQSIEAALKQAEQQIKATGNKGANEALKKLLESVADKQVELSEVQAILAEAVAGKFRAVDDALNQHGNRVNRAVSSLSGI